MKQILSGSMFVMLALFASQANGGIIYQTGFEPPTYSTGQLAGQNGWGDGTISAVETSTVFAGAQAAEFVASSATGQSLTAHGISYDAVGNPEQLVTFQDEFFVTTQGTPSSWDPIVVESNLGFFAQLRLRTDNTAELGVNNSSIGDLPVTRGQWNNFELTINFSTHIAIGYVNGVSVGTLVFSSPPTSLIGFEWGLNSSPGTDTAYMDNLLITSAAVPEPSSAVLAAIAIIAVACYTAWTITHSSVSEPSSAA